MSGSEPRTIPFQGMRIRYDSAHTYDDVVAALLREVGEVPVLIDEIGVDAHGWEDYRERVAAHVGRGGFMLFATFNHGGWLPKAGVERKALRLIVGNPLIAITMLKHDVTAGLFAPVELLVMDESDGRSSVTYVQPSSLMVVEPNAPLLAAARALDDELAALVTGVVGTA